MPQGVVPLKIADQAEPEMGGHFGIGEGAVMDASGLQVLVADQGFQGVTGGGGIDPTCEKHGAGHLLAAGFSNPGELVVEKTPVEAGVVRHQGKIADETDQALHDLGNRRCGTQHLIGDAGVVLDETTDLYSGIHQALEAVNDRAVFYHYRADLDGAVTAVGGEAGGFEVEDDGVEGAHGRLRFRRLS